jgi:hypothetical protein
MRWYRLRKVAVTAAILVALPGVWGWSIGARQALVLYDNFDNPIIDPERWIGQDVGGSQTDRLEQVREIRANRLRLASRIYGESLFTGGSKNGGSRIFFQNPSVRVMEADFRVTQVEATACAPLEVGALTRGVLQGLFFNAGADVPPPNDRTDEVGAGIQILRSSNSLDPPDVLRANAFVFQCTNAACTTSTSLNRIALGTVAVNQKVRLRLEWDEAKSQFVYQFGKNDPAFLNYALPVRPSVINNRIIEVSNSVPNCGGGVRSSASMELHVDDVYVNAGQ